MNGNYGNGEGVDSLLNELHQKKRWLDTMIEGLEAAIDSPQHKLIELAKSTFENHQGPAPRVDLEHSGKAALMTLAKSVGKAPSPRKGQDDRAR